MKITLTQLVGLSKLRSPEDIKKFHEYREEAFQFAKQVYADRVISYNADHEPLEEMVFGALSLASELYKRAKRMCGILSPERQLPYRKMDINRLMDICVDNINYNSWLFGALKLVLGAETNPNGDDSPNYRTAEEEEES